MAKFQKLSPVISDKDRFENSSYREAFDYVFSNNEIRNIAVSGAYGAGKTSVFESYIHHWKRRKKIIHISLAHFEQFEVCDEETKKQDESNLEAKIINQLVHQVDPSKIKKTNFVARIKEKVPTQLLKSIMVTTVTAIVFFLIFLDKLQLIFTNLTLEPINNLFSFLSSNDGLLLLCTFLCLFLFIFIFSVIRHSRDNNLLKKLSFKDFSIDFLNEDTDSFFDKYLSEIRYLFDRSGSKIVAIEDIDRYLSSSIFEKIRELNTVINFECKKPIRFFYIIKDDIFSSKDRTKFFDFIIPIVPIVDSSNSYSQLRTQLIEGAEGSEINNWFLRGLSIYIDDMRVLKNIINEFKIYEKELAKQELDPNKLLALITYKNLFPKDFNDLQFGTGFLFNLNRSINLFKEFVLSKDNEEILKLNKKIEAYKNEHLRNLEELGVLFLKPTPYLEMVGDKRIDNFESQLSLFNEIVKNPSESYVHINSERKKTNLSGKIEDIKKNTEYSSRKEVIDLKLTNGIASLEIQKSKIESHVTAVNESRLISKLIDSSNIDHLLNLPLKDDPEKYHEITTDLHYDIIAFLLRNGIIDGNYKDYLTYFYDNELKIQDQTFIRSVFDEKPLVETHKLTNPQAILQNLEGVSENNPAYLNTNLFFYVFDNEIKNEAVKFIALSKNNKNIKLIIAYLKEGRQIPFLIQTLNKVWDSFYADTEGDSKWSYEDRNLFLKMELLHEKPEVLKIINYLNDLSTDIENNNDLFGGLQDEKLTNIIDNLLTINVKLQDITALAEIARPLLDVVMDVPGLFLTGIYKNNLYKNTTSNIRYWLRIIYKFKENIEDGQLLSALFSKNEEPLYKYTADNLNELIGSILNNCPTVEFKDNQSTIYQLLISESTSLGIKKEYVYRLSSLVEDISIISDIKVINLLLENDRVKFSSNNLIALFVAFEKVFTTEFSDYLTKHENDRVEDKFINAELYSKELVTEFLNSVLSDSSLNKMVTKTLLEATGLKVTKQTTIVDKEKAEALVSSNTLVMNISNLSYIRTNFPDLVLAYEKRNLKNYKAILDSEKTTNAQEIVNLLESDIDGREQISLLSHAKANIPYKETYRYPSVKKYIIKSLLDIADIEKLIADPIVQLEPLISASVVVFVDNVDYIIQNEIALSYPLFTRLKNTESVLKKEIIEIFSNSLVLYTPKEIKESIVDLNIAPFVEMFTGKRPKLESNPLNLRILSVLEKKSIAKESGLSGRIYLLGKHHKNQSV